MKNKLIILFCAVTHLAVVAEPKIPPTFSINATNRFLIDGMHCNGCANGLAAELRLLPGVARAEVTLSNRLAVVAFNTNQIRVKAIVEAIQEAGFKAEPKPAK